jgi:hypothetical protein
MICQLLNSCSWAYLSQYLLTGLNEGSFVSRYVGSLAIAGGFLGWLFRRHEASLERMYPKTVKNRWADPI